MNIYILKDCIANGETLKAGKSHDIAPNIAQKLIARGYAEAGTGKEKAKPAELKEDF